MKFKVLALLAVVIVCSTFFAGCAAAPTTTAATTTDVVAAASIVGTAEAFELAISAEGKWIICLTKDLTIDKDLVLDGDFLNGKKDDNGNDIHQRKIALYAQDADRNITAEYTLTVKSLTVNSPNARIQNGTFVGDIYVNADNFQLVGTTVTGNVYFASEAVKATFTMDADSTVSGVQEVKAN